MLSLFHIPHFFKYIFLIPPGRDPALMPPEIRVSAKLRSLMSLRLGSDTLDVHWLNAPGLNSPLSLNSKRQLCFTCCIIAHRLKFCCFCFEFTSFTGSSLLFRAGIFLFFPCRPLFISRGASLPEASVAACAMAFLTISHIQASFGGSEGSNLT